MDFINTSNEINSNMYFNILANENVVQQIIQNTCKLYKTLIFSKIWMCYQIKKKN